MYKTEGYWDVKPKIKRLSFPKRGKFQVDLQDGRSVMMPISAFPSLKKVPVKERDNWYHLPPVTGHDEGLSEVDAYPYGALQYLL